MDRRIVLRTGLGLAAGAWSGGVWRDALAQTGAQTGAQAGASADPAGPAQLPPAAANPGQVTVVGTPTMPSPQPSMTVRPSYSPNGQATYSKNEIVNAGSDFLGVSAEAIAGAIAHTFDDLGLPTGYVAGQEASVAWALGVRYGDGMLYMKNRPSEKVFWRGPSVGFDLRADAARVFTLCYNLQYPEAIYQRFPGVEGSAYLIGGLGVNYQKANDIVLAPVRAGVGLGLGANVGYLAYSRKSSWLPF